MSTAQIEAGKRNFAKGRAQARINGQLTKKARAVEAKLLSNEPTAITEWTRLIQLEMPKSASKAERRLARVALRTMIGCMTGKIAGAKARLRYTAAVRLREEIHGYALGSSSASTVHSDSSLTIELSPLLTPPSLRHDVTQSAATKEQPKLDAGEPSALPED